MCEATKDNGATERQMIARYREACRGEARQKSELEEAAEIALRAFQVNSDALDQSDAVLSIALIVMLALLGILIAIGRLLPGRVLRLITGPTVERIRTVLALVRTRRAANDEVFELLQRALREAA